MLILGATQLSYSPVSSLLVEACFFPGGGVGGGGWNRPSAGSGGRPLLVQSSMVDSFHFPVTGSDRGM